MPAGMRRDRQQELFRDRHHTFPTRASAESAVYAVILAVSFCHLLNDMMQSLLPAHLSDAEGRLRPRLLADRPDHPDLPGDRVAAAAAVGMYTDQRPLPYSLPVGMGATLVGLRPAGAMPPAIRCCSRRRRWSASARRCSIRNPRASRGSPRAGGTASRSRCSRSAAMSARRSGRCWPPSSWCRDGQGEHRLVLARRRCSAMASCGRSAPGTADASQADAARPAPAARSPRSPRRRIAVALAVLAVLIFSKNFYMASITSYYTFYVIEKFGVSVQSCADPSVRVPRRRSRLGTIARRPDRRPLRRARR